PRAKISSSDASIKSRIAAAYAVTSNGGTATQPALSAISFIGGRSQYMTGLAAEHASVINIPNISSREGKQMNLQPASNVERPASSTRPTSRTDPVRHR